MREVEVRVTGAAPRRVLLVGMDGGVGQDAMAADVSFHVCAARSFAEATQLFPRFRPEAFVVSFEDPSPDDVAELRKLRVLSSAPILVMSKPVEERRVTEFIKAGAGGYLYVEDARRLPDAVRELLRGGVPMSGPVSRLVLGRARRSSAKMAAVLPSTPAAEGLLTLRQREILTLLANGHSYEDIGLALGLSVNTVRTHVRTIYDRLGASTKVEAVVAAIELRLIDREPFR